MLTLPPVKGEISLAGVFPFAGVGGSARTRVIVVVVVVVFPSSDIVGVSSTFQILEFEVVLEYGLSSSIYCASKCILGLWASFFVFVGCSCSFLMRLMSVSPIIIGIISVAAAVHFFR